MPELRLETVFPDGAPRRRRRRAARAHPYEEPAFDVYAAAVKARLSTDGGARGNPGPAAYGYVLEAEDGTVLAAHGEAIGVATNNVAEYSALVAGLAKAVELGVDEVEVVSDSELLVKQMRGEYRVKNEALRELSGGGQRPGAPVQKVRYTAVRREHNELADQLVNEALDAGLRTAAILAGYADVAQLARASACHAEGRGFESHHPLFTKALERAFFVGAGALALHPDARLGE